MEELSVLNEIATAVSSTQSLEQIIDQIVRKCVKHLHVQQAVVNLLDESPEIQQLNTMIRQVDASSVIPIHLDAELTGWVIKHQKPLLSNVLHEDKRFRFAAKLHPEIRSVLSVPMCLKGRIIGLITCFNKKSREGFNAADQRLLCIIASQSAQTIANAKLREKEQALNFIHKELGLASEIQLDLLPRVSPQIPDYDIYGKSIPARIVGGDYFDFIPMDENRLAFSVGDIAGKGLSAAMLMANLQATIRGLALMNLSPEICMGHANALLHQCTEPQKFATLVYGILNFRTHRFILSNAGHNRPILISGNRNLTLIETAGLALSLIPDHKYRSESMTFEPGDTLVLFSDGITEAMNGLHQKYGDERFWSMLQSNHGKPAQEIVKAVFNDVQAHAGPVEQSDDMTLVVIRRTG